MSFMFVLHKSAQYVLFFLQTAWNEQVIKNVMCRACFLGGACASGEKLNVYNVRKDW